jgi:hypothetical protein
VSKLIIRISFLLLVIFVCAICIWFIYNLLAEEEKSCPAVPDWFSETDLVGSWLARGYGTDSTSDMLVFQADGSYKQVVELERSPYHYESDWYSWRIEYGPSGIPYLYLESYRACAAGDVNCDLIRDDGFGFPFCCGERPPESRSGETILTLLGPSDFSTVNGTLSDIRIMLFRGCEASGWIYIFQGQ